MMSILRLTISLCLVATAFTSVNAVAQKDESGQIMKQHPLMMPVDGSKNPEKIPDYMKYHIFFQEYVNGFRNQLITHITSNDDKILSDAAAGLEGWHIQESARYRNAIQEHCSNPVTHGYIAQVRKGQGLAAETNRRAGEHHRTVIGSLSVQGSEAVETLVSTEITPNMKTSLFDADRWFADDPDGAKKNFEDGCYFAINGHYPPDVQAIIDENRELAKQQAQRFWEEKRREWQQNDN